jgi:hypothetical protein
MPPTQRKKSYCAPHKRDLERASGSCLTLRELALIAHAHNASCAVDRAIRPTAFATKATLWGALSERFREQCSDHGEYCWVQQQQLVSGAAALAEVAESFRPVMPRTWYANRRQWLNTYDILLVMRQYERQHKGFRFVGVFPVDFAFRYDGRNCVSREMCELDVTDVLGKGKTTLGFVFNHDRHNQQGSHWVALFCCLDPTRELYGTYYYDSVGRAPKPEVRAFMAHLQAAVGAAAAFKVAHNTRQHQFKNTEACTRCSS